MAVFRTSTLVAIAAAIATVSAVPTTPVATVAERDLVARDTPGNVYICGGANWAAPCGVLNLGTAGTCYSLPSTYRENVGSIGPDRGAICRLFDDTTNPCTGSGLAILSYPGDSNLFDGAAEGRKARYISCHTCTNCT